jgi:RNA polymerase sigma-70 factor (ECF subfamily)
MPTEVAFADVYRRHGPAVFRRARQILGVDADAHEVVQDVFLSLFEKPDQFAGLSLVTTFLYSATTHACLNRVRNRRNRERLERERLSGDDSDTVNHALTPEQRSMLHRALERLPEDLAQVAVYYWVDGLTHQEIARLLSCSRRHVGHLLERLSQWSRLEESPSC